MFCLQVKFHYPCGKENLCITELFGEFQSFCPDHRSQQKLPVSFSSECPFCDEMCDPMDSFFLACCNKSWVHTKCAQLQADKTGIDSSTCPNCRNKEDYIASCQKFGGVLLRINLDKEEDMLKITPNECSRQKCCCPYGTHFSDDHRFRFFLCTFCNMYKIHQSCREAKDFPDFKCILCQKGKTGQARFSVKKSGGQASVRMEPEAIIDGPSVKEESDVKNERDEDESSEKFRKRSPRKQRSTRSREEVGFDAEFSDISSGDDETAFEKEERESTRARRRREKAEDEDGDDRVMVEGKHEISKPAVNAFHPAIRDLTKPPRGTKFTTKRNLAQGKFVPRPAQDGMQQKREPMNLVKLDPQTILSLASSGNPANIEKADQLLQQLTSRFGGSSYSLNKTTVMLTPGVGESHVSNNDFGGGHNQQHHQQQHGFHQNYDDKHNRSRERFQPRKANWGKFDNRRDYRDNNRNPGNDRYHRHQQQLRGRNDSNDRSHHRSRDFDRKGGDFSRGKGHRYDSSRSRRYEQYNNAGPENSPSKEKPNLTHVPKSLVENVYRDIENEKTARVVAEEKARNDALDAKKRIEEELRKIQEEEDAKRKEKEQKKAATTSSSGGWKPLGDRANGGGTKDDEPEEGEAEASSDDESSSSSSSSDSESSSDTEKKSQGGEENLDENDKRPDISKLLEFEPEVELTEEEHLFNLQKFSELGNEYKKRFRALEDGIRKLHTDVVFYAERCDQDMIQGVQSQCNLYLLEINRLFQLCKQMKNFATAEGTKNQVNTFVVRVGDAENELKTNRGIVDEFAQLIEKITILEELLVEQIKEEALIVEPIMQANDLRTQPRTLLEKVRAEVETALAESSENPKSLHRNYEQFVNKLNSMLRNADVKSDKVASLESSVMEHQENLGKHLKELRSELNDRNNLRNFIDEIAKLLTANKTTAENIEQTKSHPDRAMSCIQGLRKEYKRLQKGIDKYRVKYSSLSLELPDGAEDLLNNLKETKAKLEIELEALITKCEGWKKEAVPLLDRRMMLNNNEQKQEELMEKKKGFGFHLKLSDQTQKVIKDGNQLLKAQILNNEKEGSDSSDNEENSDNKSEEDDLSTKIPEYMKPLPKLEQTPQPIMPPPINSVATSVPNGMPMPPVPPQMPMPPNFPFMGMQGSPMFPPNMQMPPYMPQPPQFPGFPGQHQGMPMQYAQMQNPYMQMQQPAFSAPPNLIQAQPMHYGQQMTMPNTVQAAVTGQPTVSQGNIEGVNVSMANMPDMSLIEAAAKALENVAPDTNDDTQKPEKRSKSEKKTKKKKKVESSDSEIETVNTFPKAEDLVMPKLTKKGKEIVNESVESSRNNSDTEALESGEKAFSKKALKDKRRKDRKNAVISEVAPPQPSETTEEESKKLSAFSYAAAIVGLESSVLDSEDTYDPTAPTIENYSHAVDTNSYEVVYRPEKGDFVLVQKNSEAAASAHAEQKQVTESIEAAQKAEEEETEEQAKIREQKAQEKRERRKAAREAAKREREIEREEEAKSGVKKSSRRLGTLTGMLSLLSEAEKQEQETKEQKERESKEAEKVEPITCIHITQNDGIAKRESPQEVNSTTMSPPVKQTNETVAALSSVSPASSDKVTSSQPGFAPTMQLVEAGKTESSAEEGELEEDGEVNSDEEKDQNQPRVVFDEPQKARPVQDEKIDSNVCVPVCFSQEEPTSTISDEALAKSNLSVSTKSVVTVQQAVIPAGETKNQGHTISFDDDEDDNEENSATSDEGQPSLVPSKSLKAKKVASLVPPPPPVQRKRKKKDQKETSAESPESSDSDSDNEDDSSSSSDEAPQLTKKEMKKMMKFYAMFQKSKSKKKSKKKKKAESSSEEGSSEEETPKKRKRRLSKAKAVEESDSDSSSEDASPSKKKAKLKNRKTAKVSPPKKQSSPFKISPKSKTPPSQTSANKAQGWKPQVEQNDDSDEINMSSFFTQECSSTGEYQSISGSKSQTGMSLSPVALSVDAILAKFLPEYKSIDSDPPVAALSRHFSHFWEYFNIVSDKDAALARQMAIGLLEGANGFSKAETKPVSMQTQMLLTMLKNMKTW